MLEERNLHNAIVEADLFKTARIFEKYGALCVLDRRSHLQSHLTVAHGLLRHLHEEVIGTALREICVTIGNKDWRVQSCQTALAIRYNLPLEIQICILDLTDQAGHGLCRPGQFSKDEQFQICKGVESKLQHWLDNHLQSQGLSPEPFMVIVTA